MHGMKHDFQNLSTFDTATVIMIVLGILIVGLTGFLASPDAMAASIKDSVQILDTTDSWNQSLHLITHVYNTQAEFYEQFYLAFTQVAVLPEQTLELPQKIVSDFLSLADEVVQSYQTVAYNTKPDAGRILGEMLLLNP